MQFSHRFPPVLLCLILILTLGFGCGDDDDDDSPGVADDDDVTDDDDDTVDDDDITDDDDDTVDDDDDTTDDDDDTVDDDDDTTDDDDDDFVDQPVTRLNAAVTRGYLDVPIGIPMGGFGARLGPRTPYSVVMGGSEGYYDRLNIKVMSLHMNDMRIVFAKADLPWPTESLRTQIVSLVNSRIGVDLDRRMILTGTHSHSGPAKFFYVPNAAGLIGMDTYDQELTDRIATSIADKVVEAIMSEEPAEVGHGYIEGFDPNSNWVSDRRCENGPGTFKEDRLWVLKVVDASGDTMGMLVSLAVHGVMFNTTYMTGDAPGGIERGVEAQYDSPVTAIFIQGSAGDASPRSGPYGHGGDQRPEIAGYWIGRMVKEIEEGITTQAQPELKIITKRYSHDRQTLGYQPGEFGWVDMAGNFREFPKGALECAVFPDERQGSIEDCDNPSTTLVDGYLGCLVDLNWPIFADAIPYLMQSPISVAQIGDQYFFTAPGEITAHLAVDIREAIASELSVDYEQTNTIGYAQNYIFYMTQDWDWWQGGFEVEGSLFGWRFGRWLTNEVPMLTADMMAGETVIDPEPKLAYRNTAPLPVEKSENCGAIEDQPSSSYTVFDTVSFAWHGGHPGVDNFTVTLQQDKGQGFEDVLHKNGMPYTEKGWEMIVSHDPNPNYFATGQLESRDFLYLIDWETNWDDPAGTLRFKIEGFDYTDTGVVPYEAYTDAFTLTNTDTVELTNLNAWVDGSNIKIEVEAAYPATPNGHRLRSPYAGGSSPAIVSGGQVDVTVTPTGMSPVTVTLAFDENELALVGETPLVHSNVETTVSIGADAYDDGYGNTNAATATDFVFTPNPL